MISLSTNQLRQLEKHILSKKEHAKLFFGQMCVEHCRTTSWYEPLVDKLTCVTYGENEYTFERYKLEGNIIDGGASVVLIPLTNTDEKERVHVFGNKEVTYIYTQVMNNINKHCKELWSLYDKTWKITADRLAREEKRKQRK